jgi:D-lyxose ketol-isomerase
MKRSEINQYIKDAMVFLDNHKFLLPPFSKWTFDEWKTKGNEVSEIIENGLGWDVTDFGSNDYNNTGLLVFTMRNGKFGDTSPNAKPYCEKMLLVQEGQVTPYHHHNSKVEDIINRGGGILLVEIYKSNENDEMTQDPYTVSMDGMKKEGKPGQIFEVKPGESITLEQHHFHKFWGKLGHGSVLVGEVSAVNDDYVDNVFYGGLPRFSEIEEDEDPIYLLYDDYKKLLKNI